MSVQRYPVHKFILAYKSTYIPTNGCNKRYSNHKPYVSYRLVCHSTFLIYFWPSSKIFFCKKKSSFRFRNDNIGCFPFASWLVFLPTLHIGYDMHFVQYLHFCHKIRRLMRIHIAI